LTALNENGVIESSLELAKNLKIEHQELVGYLNSLVVENYLSLEVKEI